MPKNRFPSSYFPVLVIVTAVNLMILFVRNKVEGNSVYNFLMFNLMLAFIPLVLAMLTYFFLRRSSMIVLVIASLIWLFFYPNAPYMISDLIHVDNANVMVVYDTLIIFSFSVLAIFYGFFSLKIIHLCFRQRLGWKTANYLMIIAIVLSSAGIYLGRVLRLNSWDLLTRPMTVVSDIFDHLLPVNENPATYAMIFLFSGIQFMFLVMMKKIEEVENEKIIAERPAVNESLVT